MELSGDFQYVLDMIEKGGKNLFVTGRAGTGKSTLLKLFKNTTRKNLVVLAPTGIAALNVGGQTIHSFFRLPPKPMSFDELVKRRKQKMYKKIETIIIDEISMVRADLLDSIDILLRLSREDDRPFGGVQMVFFGDLFQLPPVVSSDVEAGYFSTVYESPYFFSAQVFNDGFEMKGVELNKVYRQDNRHFLRLLEAVRLNRVDYDDLDDLNERYDPKFEAPDFYITLAARNATVHAINKRKLDQIPLDSEKYKAQVTGSFPANLYPTDAALQLKLNAQVMFIKNDPEGQFVNGTIGKVVKLEKDTLTVLVADDKGEELYIKVHKMDWEIVKYKLGGDRNNQIETETLGTFTQFPLKLAWAITIHKSQGKTFDKMVIDMGRAFEFGQTYVALSRCRTLEGIVLKKELTFQDIKTDPRVVDFYERFFD